MGTSQLSPLSATEPQPSTKPQSRPGSEPLTQGGADNAWGSRFAARTMRELAALEAATPGWSGMTAAERRALWQQHLGALFPDVPTQPPKPACTYCHDARFVHPTDQWGKVDYSQVIPCRQCERWTPEDRARRLALAGIPVNRQGEDFDSFQYQGIDGLEGAYLAAWEIGHGDPDWCLLLIYGEHGTGKTHLARAAMMAAAARGMSCRYRTVTQLCSDLREAMEGHDGETADGLVDSLCGLGFLVLDELGTENKRSDYQAATLEHIVNRRYDEHRRTILVTNEPIADLPSAIRSRCQDGRDAKMVLNGAPDYRPRRQKGG